MADKSYDNFKIHLQNALESLQNCNISSLKEEQVEAFDLIGAENIL